MITRYQLIMMCLYRQNDKLYRDIVKMIANKVYKSDDETYNYHLEYCTRHVLFSWFSPKVDPHLIVDMFMDIEVDEMPELTEEFLKSHSKLCSYACTENMINRKRVLEDIQLWNGSIYGVHNDYFNGFRYGLNSIYLVNALISYYYNQEIDVNNEDWKEEEKIYIGMFVKRPKRFNCKYYHLGHPKSQQFLIHPTTRLQRGPK